MTRWLLLINHRTRAEYDTATEAHYAYKLARADYPGASVSIIRIEAA
jgi:hypothetical protein